MSERVKDITRGQGLLFVLRAVIFIPATDDIKTLSTSADHSFSVTHWGGVWVTSIVDLDFKVKSKTRLC
jgi:hypothetical protein